MPLILEQDATKDIYKLCADNDLTLARIGYTNQDHLQAIIRGASQFATDKGIKRLPLGIFATVGHYVLQQLPRYLDANFTLPTKGGDPKAYRRRLLCNIKLATDFMTTLTDPEWSDFGNVHVIHHYDHGHHTLPGGVLSKDELLRDADFLKFFSSVMFDDSHSPFEENMKNSREYREYLEKQGTPRVLEGCLEEVAAGGAGLEESTFTRPSDIVEYLEKTGYELVVPNIGTESVHGEARGVQWQILEELQELTVGHCLVIHGFSSIRTLDPADQKRLGPLGCVAMNAFSYIPQRIGRQGLERAANILKHQDDERGLPVDFDGDTPVYKNTGDANDFFGPLLDQVRDFQVREIAATVYEILDNLGYEKLAS